jgi:hypothetical protein
MASVMQRALFRLRVVNMDLRLLSVGYQCTVRLMETLSKLGRTQTVNLSFELDPRQLIERR